MPFFLLGLPVDLPDLLELFFEGFDLDFGSRWGPDFKGNVPCGVADFAVPFGLGPGAAAIG